MGFVSQAATACWRAHSSKNWNWGYPNPNLRMCAAGDLPQAVPAVSPDRPPSQSNRYSMKQIAYSLELELAIAGGVFDPREELDLYRGCEAR